MYLATELHRVGHGPGLTRSSLSQKGQATAEYALVIVGAATIAGLVLAWAGSTGKITRLLNAVLDAVIGQVG